MAESANAACRRCNTATAPNYPRKLLCMYHSGHVPHQLVKRPQLLSSWELNLNSAICHTIPNSNTTY